MGRRCCETSLACWSSPPPVFLSQVFTPNPQALVCSVSECSGLSSCSSSSPWSWVGEASTDVSSEDTDLGSDRELVEAVEALLSRIQAPGSSTEKRGSIPLCGMGDRCAMKFGPRIGKLCDCGRGANCNAYLLKCL